MNPHLSIQKLAARTLLSSMPDDVFNIYIVPLIEGHGWPFHVNGTALDVGEARRWHQMFDRQSVQTIRQLSWERHEFTFASVPFHPRSQQVVQAIIEHHSGVAFYAAIANVADSRNKFLRARDYVARTGQMPRPVILQDDPLGVRILDGNHRVAAMASFSNSDECLMDAWLGSPPRHPIPNG